MSSPRIYPLAYRPGEAGVLELREEDYRRASFLDERLLQDGHPLGWRPWGEMLDLADAGRPVHWLFHIGHVGSTLLARLIGEEPTLFALREPALLRPAALGQPSPPLAELVQALGRVWRPEQEALVKATSFAAVLAPALMAYAPGAALLLSVTPPVYLRTILAGPASREESVALASLRSARVTARLGGPAAVAASAGERIALGWLAGMLDLADAAAAQPERCRWLDFEQVLAAPATALALALRHLGRTPDPPALARWVQGPIMSRYAKAPEHGYDPDLRRQLLEAAAREAPGEVRAGMDWLAARAAHPKVHALLTHSAAMGRKLDAPALA